MRDHGCPGGEENRRAHTEFVVQLDRFRTAFNDDGPSPELMGSFSAFLTAWITGHIEKIDVQNLRRSEGTGEVQL